MSLRRFTLHVLNLARILDNQLLTFYRLAANPMAELDRAVCNELCWMTEFQSSMGHE